MALEAGTLGPLYVKEISWDQLCQGDGGHEHSPLRHLWKLHHGENAQKTIPVPDGF